MSDNKYSVLLGVELDTGDLKSQINKTKIDPIKINFEIDSKKEAKAIKDSLINTLKNLKVDNSSITQIISDIDKMNLKLSETNVRIKDNNSLEISIKGVNEAVSGVKTVVDSVQEFKTTVGKDGALEINLENPLKKSKSISRSFKNLGKDVDEAFNTLKQKQKEINSLELKLFALDPKKDINQINELKFQIGSLKTEYNELFKVFSTHFSDSQIDTLAEECSQAASKVDLLKSKLADTSNANAFKEINQEMTNFVKLQSKISSMQTKIDELKLVGGSENEIAFLEKELKGLEATYNELMHTFQQKLVINADILDTGDIAKFDEEIAAATQRSEKELAEFEAKLADTRAKMAKGIELKLGSDGKFATQVAKVKSDLGKLSNASIDLRIDVEQLDATMRAMNLASESGDIEGLIRSYKEYEAVLGRVQNQLKQVKIAEQTSVSAQKLNDDIVLFQAKIDSYLTKNSAAAKEFGSKLLELRDKAQGCDRVTLNHLESEFKQIDKAVEAAGKKTQTFGDKLKSQFEKYKTYLSVATLFMYASQGLRDMFEQVKAIDSAMTELKKVTNETDASYNQFLSNAASRAKELGTTVEGLVSSTADFARLGYGFEDAQGLAEVANIYAVVGDEIEGVEGATQSLVSTMAAFKHEMDGMSDSDFALSIVDKFNEVSNNFAISSGGIGEALTRSASSLAAANNTLDESIALITAANTVVNLCHAA